MSSSKFFFQRLALLTALSIFLTASGCRHAEGPPRVAIRGSVSLDTKALPSGVIRFLPTGGSQGPATSAVIKEGRYEFDETDGPIPGSHRVEIEATDYLGFSIDDEAAFAATIQQRRRPLEKNPVPEIYNRRSTLLANIDSEGSPEFNFELSSKRKPLR